MQHAAEPALGTAAGEPVRRFVRLNSLCLKTFKGGTGLARYGSRFLFKTASTRSKLWTASLPIPTAGGAGASALSCRVSSHGSARYWPWLEAFDPDIVYSFVSLTPADVVEIHERVYPAEYVFHQIDTLTRSDVYGFKPRLDFAPLSSMSVVFRLARHSPRSDQGGRVSIIDSWYTESPTRYLTDNFGTYHWSAATGQFPTDATGSAALLTVVSTEKYEDRSYGVPRDLNRVGSEFEAVKQFAAGAATSLSLLSALYSPKLEIQDYRWSESFNLVIGESFEDRILFWNARLFIPTWIDRSLCCLRINSSQLHDHDFLAQLSEMINRRNFVRPGSGGQSQLTVRSVSVSQQELEVVRSTLGTANMWSATSIHKLATLDELAPAAAALERANETSHYVDTQVPSWTSFKFLGSAACPPTIIPDHLADAPIRQTFTQGYWSADFRFQYDGVNTRYGRANCWNLPRRWRMAQAFRPSIAGHETHSLPPPPRRSRHGNLTLFSRSVERIEQVQIPVVEEAFHFAFVLDGRYVRQDRNPGEHPGVKVQWLKESNEARYLTGVLGMTGGLDQAIHFLLHPFLRDVFAKLGGAPNLADTDIAPTLNALRKLSQGHSKFDLDGHGEVEALAGLIARAAQSTRRPMAFVAYDELRQQWKGYRERYWAKNTEPKRNPDDPVDWNAQEERSLDDALIALREGQLLFQGHRWTCFNCHHRNWADLGSLTYKLLCEVCKCATDAPVNIRWQFRPNQFLIESLRDHSVLSLVWVLAALRNRATNSFIYQGPTSFGYSADAETPDAEADILALIDGEAVLCEVKSAWRSLRAVHVDALVELAKRLRPDRVVLAVMEGGVGHKNKVEEAKTQLSHEGIELELLTTAQYRAEDDPWL